MLRVLVRNWWAFVIRGVLAVGFGLFALLLPGVTMLSLVLVFAAYAIADGVFTLIAAVRAGQKGERWDLLALESIAGIVAGIAASVWPGLTVYLFVILVAAWALVTGALMLGAAFRVDGDHGRGWLMLAALTSIVYGALLVIAPLIGAVVLTWWIGAYALVFGIAMLAFALRLRSRFMATPLAKMA